jgi:hypothetical protein
MAEHSPAPPGPSDPDRLNGWKEIAAYLGKGVRTAQRWEKDYQLPIRRLGRQGGEIVIASRRELEAWLSSGPGQAEPDAPPPPTPGPSRPGWRTLVAAGLGLLLFGTSAGWQLARMAAEARESVVVAARVEQGQLVAYDGLGRAVWRRANFGFRLQDQDYAIGHLERRLLVEDLDEDGVPEVVIGAYSRERHPRMATYILNNNGSVRAVVRPANEVRYGTDAFTGPWLPHRLFVVRGPDGPHLYATFVDGALFPTLLLSLDAGGAIEGEFWSDGYVSAVALGERHDRPALLVAATNNETRGAALALFDSMVPSGSMPAHDSKYRCSGCPAGGPAETLLFPERDIARSVNGTMSIDRLFQEGRGGVRVLVTEGPAPADGHRTSAVWYHLDAAFALTRIEVTIGAVDEHRRQKASGALTHDYGPQDRQDLVPACRWIGGAWTPVTMLDTLEGLTHFADERAPWDRP